MGWSNIWERLEPGFAQQKQFKSKVPLVELYGGKRILIENHCGVLEYTDSLICVKVNCGQVCICGSELELAMMSAERLIICGKIQSVQMKEA